MKDEEMRKWQNHSFSSGSDTGDDYIAFQQAMKTDLNKQLKSVGLKLKRFNKNHYCFSAVATDGEHFVYISINDVRWSGRIFNNVLYRTMAHENDWRGGINRYCHWNDIGTVCKELLGK